MSYVFASGVIAAKSGNLLSETQYLTLLKTDKSEYFKTLRDLGYGFDHVAIYLDEVIANELVKTKTELLAIVPYPKIIRLWFLKYNLVNIKTIIKNHLFPNSSKPTFERAAIIAISELKEALINQNFDNVSDDNQLLLQELSPLTIDNNRSSQEISNIIDQIVYKHIFSGVNELNDEALLHYFKKQIDANNLTTLFRAQNINLPAEELARSLLENGNVDIDTLVSIFDKRPDEQTEVLKLHYSDNVLKALAKYYDDNNLSKLNHALLQDLIDSMVDFNYETFTSGPLINYLLKKEIEIRNVRILYFDKDVEVADLLTY